MFKLRKKMKKLSKYSIWYRVVGKILGPFGLAYFLAYPEQLMKINKLLCIIHKLVKIVYEKTAYENTIFVSENL
jgi:hypothetical protein